MKTVNTPIRHVRYLILAAAAAILCLSSLSSKGQETAAATVAFVEGDASINPAGDAAWVALSEGRAIGRGDEIRTGPDGSVELLLADESVLRIGPDTQVRVKEAGIVEATKLSTNVFDLIVGKVRAVVTPFVNAESRFNIETENTTVGVRGTDFGVSHDPKTKQTEVVSMDGDLELRPKEAVMKGIAPIIVRTDEGIRLIAGVRPERPVKWLEENRVRFFRGLEFKGRRTRDIIERRFKRLTSGGYEVIDRLKDGGNTIKSRTDKIKSGTERFFDKIKRR
jgi:ferric-dicitrate binding protein FerR (iron transport regulator)